jgi:hypothetical protein
MRRLPQNNVVNFHISPAASSCFDPLFPRKLRMVKYLSWTRLAKQIQWQGSVRIGYYGSAPKGAAGNKALSLFVGESAGAGRK